MVSQPIWIAIVIGVFFIGIGVSYAHFANTYDPMSMKFQNQELFDQMMTNNPKMSQQWMDSGMMGQQQMMYDPQMTNQWMNAMMDDPQMHQLMIDSMMNHQGMMNSMMNHQDMMNMMMGSGMMSGNMMTGGHMMGSGMMDSGMMSSQSSQSIPTDTEPQTRTFQISMEEVEFYAEVENEGGEEAIAFV
ncbi:MAG: hypothetical protein ACE5RM_05400, partial [Candidatus Nitrosomaritimum aestuariumsis]